MITNEKILNLLVYPIFFVFYVCFLSIMIVYYMVRDDIIELPIEYALN